MTLQSVERFVLLGLLAGLIMISAALFLPKASKADALSTKREVKVFCRDPSEVRDMARFIRSGLNPNEAMARVNILSGSLVCRSAMVNFEKGSFTSMFKIGERVFEVREIVIFGVRRQERWFPSMMRAFALFEGVET